jgi:dGTPase
MNPREYTESIERTVLSPLAKMSADSRGRERAEEKCEMRTDFARDRDRIIHSKSFRRLKQKTQVFLSPMGDHYRTRLTHTLEVSQIARTISRALRLNEDLTEAIAMGHDLGHTPFGHAGERALNELSSCGFTHYEQSVRVVTRLEKRMKGLNLTYETIDGIRNHTRGPWAETLEGRVVRYADHIAYLNHDFEDAETALLLTEDDLPASVREVLGTRKTERITTLVSALVNNFDGELGYPAEIQAAYGDFKKFMYSEIYLADTKAAKREEVKVSGLVGQLFEHYIERPEAMTEFYQHIAETEGKERAVLDYISGMTDAYAVYCFENIFVPKSWELRR